MPRPSWSPAPTTSSPPTSPRSSPATGSRDSPPRCVTAEVTRREAAQNVVGAPRAGGGLVTEVEEKPRRPGYRAPWRPRSSSTAPARCSRRCGSCAPSSPPTPRATTAASVTSASTCCRAWSSGGQVRAVPIDGYWRDLGRPGAYLQGHRDLLRGQGADPPPGPARSSASGRTVRRRACVPARRLEDSMLATGCDVAGTVVGSVLGPGVVVEPGARVEDSRALRGRRRPTRGGGRHRRGRRGVRDRPATHRSGRSRAPGSPATRTSPSSVVGAGCDAGVTVAGRSTAGAGHHGLSARGTRDRSSLGARARSPYCRARPDSRRWP